MQLLEHTRNLAGHERALLIVAVLHGLTQRTGGCLLKLLKGGIGVLLLELEALARHRGLERTHRMTGRTTGNNGRNVGSLEDELLVLIRNIALVGCEEHGAALYAFGAEHHGSCHAAAVCNAACGDDRNAQCIYDLRNERHGGQLTDVAAAFHTLCDNRICTCALHTLCQCNRSNDRHNLNACVLPVRDILARIACAGGQHFDLLVDGQLCQIVRIRGEQHDVHTERLVRDGTRLMDLLTDVIDRSCAARDNAQTACLGNRSSQMVLRDPRHRALHDWVFDTEKFCDLGFHRSFSPFIQVISCNSKSIKLL